jgi:hypothetical protein
MLTLSLPMIGIFTGSRSARASRKWRGLSIDRRDDMTDEKAALHSEDEEALKSAKEGWNISRC